MSDLSGPGPSRRTDPDTSHDDTDHQLHRVIAVQITRTFGPEGANAYEVWVRWGRPDSPSLNHVGQRLGELADIPSRPCQYPDPDGVPPLVRPGRTHPTPTRSGLVYVHRDFAHSITSNGERPDPPIPSRDLGARLILVVLGAVFATGDR